jgi:uncharacterized damage-inducible protein DinB
MFPVIFSRLEGSIFRLYQLLSNADDETCSIRKQGWSVKEHVGHLYDLEELWWKRLQDFLQNREILTSADLNNEKTHKAGHNEMQLEKLVEKFTLERQKILETVYEYNENILSITSLHPRLNTPMRLIDSLYFVAEHDDHHIAAISDLLRKPVEDIMI